MQAALLKPSKFNSFIKNEKNETIMYNSLTGNLVKFSKNMENMIQEIFSKDIINRSDIKNEELITKGFLIPSFSNENLMLNSVYTDIISEPMLNLTILTTEKCNFRCNYCFENNYNHHTQEMSLEVEDAIVDFVRKNIGSVRGVDIGWFGGEPLMRMDIIRDISQKIIAICKENKKLYCASISTNGYLLTPEVFKELYKYRVFEYQVTLDGLSETHDKSRFLANGKPTFDVIINNLKAIKETCPTEHVNFSIRTNCDQNVITNLQDFIQFFEDTFFPDMRFKVYFALVKDLGGSISSQVKKSFLKIDEIQLAEKAFSLFTHKECFDLRYCFGRLLPGNGCGYMKKGTYAVSPNGLLSKCSTHFQNYSFCNVGEIKNGKFITDPYMEALWTYDLNYNDMLDDKICAGCTMKPICISYFCPVNKVKCLFEGKDYSFVCLWGEKEKRIWEKLIIMLDQAGKINSLSSC